MTGGVLSLHKLRTRNQGANTGWGGEGANPYVHLKMFHIVAESDNNIVPKKQANKGEHCRPGGACGDGNEGR